MSQPHRHENMHTYLQIFGYIFLVSGAVGIVHALITGRVHIRGGRRTTTKSMPNNPILRSQSPRDYWFALGIFSFIFAVFAWAFLTM